MPKVLALFRTNGLKT